MIRSLTIEIAGVRVGLGACICQMIGLAALIVSAWAVVILGPTVLGSMVEAAVAVVRGMQ